MTGLDGLETMLRTIGVAVSFAILVGLGIVILGAWWRP